MSDDTDLTEHDLETDNSTDLSQPGLVGIAEIQPIQQCESDGVRMTFNTEGQGGQTTTVIHIQATNVTLGGTQTVVKLETSSEGDIETLTDEKRQKKAISHTARGGAINAKDERGRTLLYYACKNTQVEMVKQLLERGASLDDDVLEAACERGNIDIIRLLFPKSSSAKKQSSSEEDLWQQSQRTGDEATRLVTVGKALHFACKHGHNKLIGYFLAVGASVDTPGERGKSPLHVACTFNKVNVVDFLLQNSATIDKLNDEGCTPLHVALMTCSKNCVDFLLKSEAGVNIPDPSGMTPLHKALYSPSLYIRYDSRYFSGLWLPDVSMCETILRYGANVNQQDKEGNSPLHVLCRVKSNTMTDNFPSPPYRACKHADVYRRLITMLISHGADVNVKNHREEPSFHGWIQTLF